MSRKPKYSKELKIDTAKRYLNGEGSYISLSKEVGADSSIVYGWVLKYKKYGDEAFDISTINSSYTKEFKEKVVLKYLNGEGSLIDLMVKYNIPAVHTLENWIKSYNSHIELKDYIPEGEDIYMTESRKVIFSIWNNVIR